MVGMWGKGPLSAILLTETWRVRTIWKNNLVTSIILKDLSMVIKLEQHQLVGGISREY